MTSPVPLKPTTVRFAEDGMELVRQASEKVGSNFGEFVREAALMRAVIVLGDEYEMDKLDKTVRDIPDGETRAEKIKRLGRRNDP